jgi:hypothetical protein
MFILVSQAHLCVHCVKYCRNALSVLKGLRLQRTEPGIIAVFRRAGALSRLLAGRPGLDSWQDKVIFLLPQIIQTGCGAHPAFCSVGTGVISPTVKRLERDVDHSPPSSAEVKNE